MFVSVRGGNSQKQTLSPPSALWELRRSCIKRFLFLSLPTERFFFFVSLVSVDDGEQQRRFVLYVSWKYFVILFFLLTVVSSVTCCVVSPRCDE